MAWEWVSCGMGMGPGGTGMSPGGTGINFLWYGNEFWWYRVVWQSQTQVCSAGGGSGLMPIPDLCTLECVITGYY